MHRLSLLAVLSIATACASPGARQDIRSIEGADGAVRDSAGRQVAQAGVMQDGPDLKVGLHVMTMRPGHYAVHLHDIGRCDPPGFESAGPHWNPYLREHGRDNPRGQHLGDLPNLEVGANGMGEVRFTIPDARLNGGAHALQDGNGFAIVIHAAPDDYRTDPSGNSGARVACGVLR